MVYKMIGANVKRIRKAKGWTINYAAKKASLSWGHLKRIETGKCRTTLKTMFKIANTWQVQMIDFLEIPQKINEQGRGNYDNR